MNNVQELKGGTAHGVPATISPVITQAELKVSTTPSYQVFADGVQSLMYYATLHYKSLCTNNLPLKQPQFR